MMSRSITRRLFRTTVGAAILALASGAPAFAKAYPEREVTLIVQGSAGGGSDIIARTIANIIDKKKLSPTPIIVENRPGGGGAVGYTYVAKRQGDPYFIGTIGGSFFTTPLLGQSPVNYEAFTPIAAIAADPYVMVVSAKSGIKSLDQVKALKTVRVGTTGVVTDPGIIAKMMEKSLGITIRNVPYGGDGEVLAALLGGHIDVQFGNPSEILSQVQAGTLVPLAVSSATRLPQLPNVPTFKELGQDIDITQLRGVVMPKGIPPEAVKFWEGVMKQVAESEEWKREYLDRNGSVPIFLDSAAFAAELPKVNSTYVDFMKQAGLLK